MCDSERTAGCAAAIGLTYFANATESEHDVVEPGAPRASAVTHVIPSYGLSHVALVVRSAKRSFEFYQRVLGVVAVYDQPGMIQAQTPGCRDVLVFEEGTPPVGEGGVAHFGFRLVDPHDIDAAVAAVVEAGGTVIRRGDFCPGEPFVFFRDPDGYEVEIWHELPTPVDPPAAPNSEAR